MSFNPYFTGSTTSTISCSSSCHVTLWVSILILLEVPLQLTFRNKKELLAFGFNPYFTGSTTSTFCLCFCAIVIHFVSILILLEVPLQLVKKCFDDVITQ